MPLPPTTRVRASDTGALPQLELEHLGAGVAGLAAIGTATSLGAITLAFDVRPEVAEQIESMGAEFVFLEFDEEQTDGAATGGYAAPSSPEFREAQLAKFRELAPEVDIVIKSRQMIWGVEIKAGSSVSRDDAKGLLKLASIAGERFQVGIVFYDGEAILPLHKEMGTLAMPISKLWEL